MTVIRLSDDARHGLTGAVTLFCLAMLFAFGYSGASERFDDDGYRLSAPFENADGLTPGSAVFMAGFPIGTVRKLVLDKETNEARVIMTINRQTELPLDSEAVILSQGFAGGKYIRILPGGDAEMLVDGDRFDYTQGAVDFIALFEQLVLGAEQNRDARAVVRSNAQ